MRNRIVFTIAMLFISATASAQVARFYVNGGYANGGIDLLSNGSANFAGSVVIDGSLTTGSFTVDSLELTNNLDVQGYIEDSVDGEVDVDDDLEVIGKVRISETENTDYIQLESFSGGALFRASGSHATTTQFAVGLGDTKYGTITAYSAGTGSNVGGIIQVVTPPDYDTTIASFLMQAFQDDLHFGPNTDTDALIYNGGTSTWGFTTGLVSVGVNDALQGRIYGYGGSGGGGGQVLLYTGGSYDGTINYYGIQASEDDLAIGPDTNWNAMKYDGGADTFAFETGASTWTVADGAFYSSDPLDTIGQYANPLAAVFTEKITSKGATVADWYYDNEGALRFYSDGDMKFAIDYDGDSTEEFTWWAGSNFATELMSLDESGHLRMELLGSVIWPGGGDGGILVEGENNLKIFSHDNVAIATDSHNGNQTSVFLVSVSNANPLTDVSALRITDVSKQIEMRFNVNYHSQISFDNSITFGTINLASGAYVTSLPASLTASATIAEYTETVTPTTLGIINGVTQDGARILIVNSGTVNLTINESGNCKVPGGTSITVLPDEIIEGLLINGSWYFEAT